MTRSPRARPSRTKGIRAAAASWGPSKRTQTCRCLPTSASAKRIAAKRSGMAWVPSSVELVSLTDYQVAEWPGPEIRDLAAADPALALAAIDSMASSLHAAIERIDGFLHQDARGRVLRILARHRELFFGQ